MALRSRPPAADPRKQFRSKSKADALLAFLTFRGRERPRKGRPMHSLVAQAFGSHICPPLARWTTGGVVQTNEDPLPQETRRSFLKASIPLEKGDKCRIETPGTGLPACAEIPVTEKGPGRDACVTSPNLAFGELIGALPGGCQVGGRSRFGLEGASRR